MIKDFFAPNDPKLYPPCGMFSTTHLIVMTICFVLIGISVYYLCRLTKEQILKITKITAISVSILELGKITYCFSYGYTNLDSWFPLAYCSLFIYSLYMAGFGNNKIKTIGGSYIVGAGLICGLFFLTMPTTSITTYPMFHYLSVYSMLFHSLMVIFCLVYLIKNIFVPTFKNYKYYVIFAIIFAIPAVIMNGIWGCNMMFLREPYRIPLPFLQVVKDSSQIAYTFIILISYISTYLAPLGINCLINKIKDKKETRIAL